MPWHIGKHNDCEGFAVIKDDDGSLAGCHETEDEAKAQLAALYASEPEATEEADIEPGGPERCVCPDCDYSTEKERGIPCRSMTCPECGAELIAGTESEDNTTAHEAGNMSWKESLAELESYLEQVNIVVARLAAQKEDAEIVENVPESAFAETATGHVIGIEEAEVDNGKLTPLSLNVAVIEPGPGNAKDGHFYPAEVLKRDASVFKGAHMFATDHRQEEKSVGTWVSTVKACPVGFTETGGPIARVIVHKDWFARDLLALQESGLLQEMQCSILGSGKAKKGKVGEAEYSIVEAITDIESIDYVTRAGAGGRVLSLAESDASTPSTEVEMDKKEIVQESETETVILSEEDKPQESPEANTEVEAVAALSNERVTELLTESGLSNDAQKLLTREYDNEQAVQDAITEFKQILKKASGSGQPFAQGDTQPTAQKIELTEADRRKRYASIVKKHGLNYPLTEV